MSGENLTLASRFSTAPDNVEFIPRNINSLRIISLSEDRLVVSVGDKTWNFRRMTRMPVDKEINKAKG